MLRCRAETSYDVSTSQEVMYSQRSVAVATISGTYSAVSGSSAARSVTSLRFRTAKKSRADALTSRSDAFCSFREARTGRLWMVRLAAATVRSVEPISRNEAYKSLLAR